MIQARPLPCAVIDDSEQAHGAFGSDLCQQLLRELVGIALNDKAEQRSIHRGTDIDVAFIQLQKGKFEALLFQNLQDIFLPKQTIVPFQMTVTNISPKAPIN
jgi:hypothetical protein